MGKHCRRTSDYNIWIGLFVVLNATKTGWCQVGIIQRVQQQQVIATLPSTLNSFSNPLLGTAGAAQVFITSPSGTFRAALIRRQTNTGTGSLGNDFCYIDVINWAAQQSTWESPCAPVTTANPCTLLLSDQGLQISDGNRDVWNSNTNQYQALVLLENGDLQLVDQNNGVVWKASDSPLVNQRCGTVGSPGSGPFNPPFASPLSPFNNQPFSPFNQPFTGILPTNGAPPGRNVWTDRFCAMAFMAAFVLIL